MHVKAISAELGSHPDGIQKTRLTEFLEPNNENLWSINEGVKPSHKNDRRSLLPQIGDPIQRHQQEVQLFIERNAIMITYYFNLPIIISYHTSIVNISFIKARPAAEDPDRPTMQRIVREEMNLLFAGMFLFVF